ncbi:Integrin beta-5 [Myotis brandtii]|uniref:Integrin beta n=2 Tax=Myotis TaxID=9434 RepID=S7N4L7_MYOBR|nr:Integrin beta-5 [Myotis brandtii]
MSLNLQLAPGACSLQPYPGSPFIKEGTPPPGPFKGLIHRDYGQELIGAPLSCFEGLNECTRGSATSCEECLLIHPKCAWCSKENFGSLRSVTSRCDLKANLVRNGCGGEFESPASVTQVLRSLPLSSKGSSYAGSDVIQMTPQEIAVNLRPGDKTTFQLQVRQVEDYPVDLYYLMDLSLSMKDDLDNIRNLGTKLAEEMRKLTSNFRLGFGSFVDKSISPFSYTAPRYQTNPCIGYKLFPNCVPSFGFRHLLPLTDRVDSFNEEVRKQRVSRNRDAPEGGFDAVLQAAVCKEKIGWRKDALHLLVFTTDDVPHIALDGKLGGLVQPHDGQCHLNEANEYTASNQMDYPSLALLGEKLAENNINLIFAVTKNHYGLYKNFTALIPGTTVEILHGDSKNIIQLIINAYSSIRSKVELSVWDQPEDLNLFFTATCQDGVSYPDQRKCEGLKIGDTGAPPFGGEAPPFREKHHSEEEKHHHSEEKHHRSEEKHHHSKEKHHHSEEKHHRSEEKHHHSEEKHHHSGRSTTVRRRSTTVQGEAPPFGGEAPPFREKHHRSEEKHHRSGRSTTVRRRSTTVQGEAPPFGGEAPPFREKHHRSEEKQHRSEEKHHCSGRSTSDGIWEKHHRSEEKQHRSEEKHHCSGRSTSDGIWSGCARSLSGFPQCRCSAGQEPDSPRCSGNGTYVCGLCECNPSYLGSKCECQEGENPSGHQNLCREAEGKPLCSGRGQCSCSQCSCFESEFGKIYGPFCECDNFSCARNRGVLCSGHGECHCGECKCHAGYIGDNCNCSTDISTCRGKKGQICSDRGHCVCGQCQCTEPGAFGETCEKCPTCPDACSTKRDCVECLLLHSGSPADNQTCQNLCKDEVITWVDAIGKDDQEAVLCFYKTAKDCVMLFTYAELPSGKSNLTVLREPECGTAPNVTTILLIVVGSILLIGFVLLGIWKLLVTIHDRREFAKFQSERSRARYEMASNPLYRKPISTHAVDFTFNKFNRSYNGAVD